MYNFRLFANLESYQIFKIEGPNKYMYIDEITLSFFIETGKRLGQQCCSTLVKLSKVKTRNLLHCNELEPTGSYSGPASVW
jgi:hypothetical protein